MGHAAIVQELYAALRVRDAQAVERLVRDHFDDEVVLHEPGSLAWGGDHAGSKRVTALFVGMATAPAGTSPIDPASMRVERTIADGDDVAADVRFTVSLRGAAPMETGAVEWFRFRAGKVVDVRAVYFDTAALVVGG